MTPHYLQFRRGQKLIKIGNKGEVKITVDK
jgi:hypothetical protein